MGLNREQWYSKITRWVPSWWFSELRYQKAVFKAISAVFEAIQEDCDDHLNQTFISRASAPILDLHGDERSVVRARSEPDSLYSIRIRNIVNQSDAPDIKKLVDALLITGECTVIEHATDLAYLNRGAFCNGRAILNDRRYANYFTVVIPHQIAISNSFASRGAFANRGNYLGTKGELPLDVLLNIIVTTITNAKAAGVLYRLIELA